MSTIAHDPHTKPSKAHRISRVASEPLPDLATRDTPLESRMNHPENEDPLIEQVRITALSMRTERYNVIFQAREVSFTTPYERV